MIDAPLAPCWPSENSRNVVNTPVLADPKRRKITFRPVARDISLLATVLYAAVWTGIMHSPIANPRKDATPGDHDQAGTRANLRQGSVEPSKTARPLMASGRGPRRL